MRKIIIGFFLAILAWQYASILILDWTGSSMYRPTDLIDAITERSQWLFHRLGEFGAHLCSFWAQLDFKDLSTAAMQLLSSIWKVIYSIVEIFPGYLNIRTWLDDPMMTDIGAMILILGAFVLSLLINSAIPLCIPILVGIAFGFLLSSCGTASSDTFFGLIGQCWAH